MHLFLNPGHAPGGQPDPGAIAPDGTEEWQINARVAQAIGVACRAAGHTVSMLQDDSLARIVAAATASGAACFLAVHANAAANPLAHGAELYVHPAAGEVARAWAARMAMLARAAGFAVRPGAGTWYRTANFYVLRETPLPAVLLEVGFLTNVGDLADLRGEAPSRWGRVVAGSLLGGRPCAGSGTGFV